MQPAEQNQYTAENWFVAQIKPNGLALATRNLQRQGIGVFTPRRREAVTRNGRMVTQLQPLFPGYAFVQFDPASGNWGKINNTRGVSRLILSDPRHPTTMPAEFMAGLLARCDADETLLPAETFDVGDRIRVLSGPFAQLVTTVDSLAKDDRLRILIDLMGRKVKTLIEIGSVEKVRG